MSLYTIDHICGHSEDVKIYGTKHELSEKNNRQEMWDKLKLDIKANVEVRNAEFFGENMEGVE